VRLIERRINRYERVRERENDAVDTYLNVVYENTNMYRHTIRD